MAELRLARPELSKRLSNRHALNSSLQQLVENMRPCRNASDLFAFFQDLHTRLEAHVFKFLSDLIALLCLGFGDALDVEHFLLGASEN